MYGVGKVMKNSYRKFYADADAHAGAGAHAHHAYPSPKWLMLHAHPIVRRVSCAVAGLDSFKLDRCDGRERVR